MAKTAIDFQYVCEICNLTISGSNDHEIELQGWMTVYPDEPNNEYDCKAYCPKHKHRSVIPKGSHVIGIPFDVILHNVIEYKQVSHYQNMRIALHNLLLRAEQRFPDCTGYLSVHDSNLLATARQAVFDDDRKELVPKGLLILAKHIMETGERPTIHLGCMNWVNFVEDVSKALIAIAEETGQ